MTSAPMTREDSINSFVAPNGRVFKIINHAPNPSLFEIRYGDDKSGDLPISIKNHMFTKRPTAEVWLKAYLAKMWDEAESRIANKRA